MFVSFTADIAAHRSALVGLVPFPDELIVCRAPISGEEVAVLHDQLVRDLEGRFIHVGRGNGRVTVGLHEGDEALAEQLVSTYGAAVEVTVGMFPYPMPDPLPDALCEQVPPAASVLELAAPDDESISVAMTEAVDASDALTLTNTSDVTVEFMHGTWIADLTRRGETTPAAHFVGFINDVGYVSTLAPDASEQLDVIVPMASCDPAVGYQIAPGDYDLYITIEPSGAPQNVPAEAFALGPVPIIVTEP